MSSNYEKQQLQILIANMKSRIQSFDIQLREIKAVREEAAKHLSDMEKLQENIAKADADVKARGE